ncbi:MAG: PEP-CTERM sorting domain-containing protein [Bryobacteraceae bacterium]
MTNLGDPVSNPFLGTPLEVSIPSGTYFLFFGFEGYWSNGATEVTLAVGYLDGTSKQEVFAPGSLAGPAMWSRISGDTSLFLGSTGIDYVDRMSDTAFAPNQVNDIVLEFSDTGTFNTAPEPATFGVAAGALGIVFLSRRRRK